MNKKYSSKNSLTDLERVNTIRDTDIDLSDVPEVTEDQIANAVMRFNGQPLKGKIRINILLDANIVAWFKTKAGGRGYQTLINEALKKNILHNDIEQTLRKVIREELNKTS